MTERKNPTSVMAWVERIALGLVLLMTTTSFLGWSQARADLNVLAERVETQQRVDEAMATHAARLAAIEASRFTRNDGDKLRERFDSQLIDVWKELQRVRENLTASQGKERERIDKVMEKLEDRIRAVENNR